MLWHEGAAPIGQGGCQTWKQADAKVKAKQARSEISGETGGAGGGQGRDGAPLAARAQRYKAAAFCGWAEMLRDFPRSTFVVQALVPTVTDNRLQCCPSVYFVMSYSCPIHALLLHRLRWPVVQRGVQSRPL
jgi:hypothetical protein